MASSLENSTVDDDWEVDSGWDLEDPAPLPPPPTPPPTLAPPIPSEDNPRGKRRRFATGTGVPPLRNSHGLRRVVAQPGRSDGKPPLPGVAPLTTHTSVLAAKVLATFPPGSEAARTARAVLAHAHATANNTAHIEATAPVRRDLTPRSRMVTAALHRFGAVCYIRSGTTSPKSQILAAKKRAANEQAESKPSFWKRLFRS